MRGELVQSGYTMPHYQAIEYFTKHLLGTLLNQMECISPLPCTASLVIACLLHSTITQHIYQATWWAIIPKITSKNREISFMIFNIFTPQNITWQQWYPCYMVNLTGW